MSAINSSVDVTTFLLTEQELKNDLQIVLDLAVADLQDRYNCCVTGHEKVEVTLLSEAVERVRSHIDMISCPLPMSAKGVLHDTCSR